MHQLSAKAEPMSEALDNASQHCCCSPAAHQIETDSDHSVALRLIGLDGKPAFETRVRRKPVIYI